MKTGPRHRTHKLQTLLKDADFLCSDITMLHCNPAGCCVGLCVERGVKPRRKPRKPKRREGPEFRLLRRRERGTLFLRFWRIHHGISIQHQFLSEEMRIAASLCLQDWRWIRRRLDPMLRSVAFSRSARRTTCIFEFWSERERERERNPSDAWPSVQFLKGKPQC